LYVDNEVGAATATGVGEEIVRICGSYAVVEMMRQGHSPSEACRLVVERYIRIRGKEKAMQMQAGFIALSKTGEYGCFSVTKDFTMAVRSANENKVVNSPYAV
jgi:isoaspartyl peptidase/L-asparaginase-like protein (Ntn-hydrolase superfamily)